MGRLAIAVCLVLTLRGDAAAPPVSHAEWARVSAGRYAYGITMRGHKVGWTIDDQYLGKHNGRPVMFSTNEMYMATLFDGAKTVKHEKTTTAYELTGDGAIVFAEVVRREDGQEESKRVERVGNKLRITTRPGGVPRTVALSRDTLLAQRQLEAWLAAPRKKGDIFTKYSASWEKADIDSAQKYEYRDEKPIVFQGRPTRSLSVRIASHGGVLDAAVLPDARLLTGTLGKLMTMTLQKESVAKKMDGPAVDLLEVTSIFINVDLGRARDVDSLKLELTGVDDFAVPASHRQIVTKAEGKAVVELKRDFRAEKASPLTEKQRAHYTRTTPQYQSDQEPVKALAKKIVGDETDALAAARRIEAWVFKNLRKSYSDNADTALAVLDSKAGDCTEHSLLFVALCRAAGLPAREAGGLAYSPANGKPMFGWHAWAEVHDGHQWVSVDPTWNQVYVDGTHLKLSSGDDDLAWTNVIGTLKIRVVEVSKRR